MKKPLKGVEKPRLVYQHKNHNFTDGVNSPQAWQEGQAVTRAGSSPQVDPFTDPAWQERGEGRNPGMGEGSVIRGGGGCCSIVGLCEVLADSR